MSDDPNSERGSGDGQLRELFSALRREDEALVPNFAAKPKPRREKRPSRFGWRLTAASVSAATIIAALLWLRRESTVHRAAYAPVASITEWRPATDFLLNTPVREILETTPTIRLRPYLNATGATPNRRPKTPRAPTPLSQ